MKIVVELNPNTKKKKAYRVFIKPDNTQLGKLVFYTDNTDIASLFSQAQSECQRQSNQEDDFNI